MLHSYWGKHFTSIVRLQQPVQLFVGPFFAVSELTIEAKTGKKSVAVATLLVHSVKVAISRHKMIAIAHGGMFCSGAI